MSEATNFKYNKILFCFKPWIITNWHGCCINYNWTDNTKFRESSGTVPLIKGSPIMETLGSSLDNVVEIFERNIIEKTLKATHGNLSEAAIQLKITRRKIHYKICKYGIDYRAIKEEYGTSGYIIDLLRRFKGKKRWPLSLNLAPEEPNNKNG